MKLQGFPGENPEVADEQIYCVTWLGCGDGCDYSGRGRIPRAIVQFNQGADGCVLEGFELSGAHNRSHNGAGVRINQANQVTIRGCSIHGNDMGIMSNGDGTTETAVDQRIENCLIHSNGNLDEPGRNHNLYLGGTSVTVRGCEIHSSLTGHNIKSRARRTVVSGCYVHDSANRELDLVDDKSYTTFPGSDAVLTGNIIVKAGNCVGNRAVIHFGQDGGNPHHGVLYVVHNTIVTGFISPVVDLSAPGASAWISNNIVWDGGAVQNGQVLVAVGGGDVGSRPVEGMCNWLASGFRNQHTDRLGLRQSVFGLPRAILPFAHAAHGDFRLTRRDPELVDQGCALPERIAQVIGGSLTHYEHPQGAAGRHYIDKPDLGAHEFDR